MVYSLLKSFLLEKLAKGEGYEKVFSYSIGLPIIAIKTVIFFGVN